MTSYKTFRQVTRGKSKEGLRLFLTEYIPQEYIKTKD
jgi:hypothetical protein